jgi:bacillithiol synthase
MKEYKVSLETTLQFGTFFLDYINQKNTLHTFYSEYPELNSFAAKIEERRSFPNRSQLVTALTKQYEHLPLHPSVKFNIEALQQANVYTVTTGHQLNLATGPLYFIYKILSTIKLCEQLKERYSDAVFVPVYWMACEDHDVAEINHFYLFGKKFEWNQEWKGAVGRMPLDGLNELLDSIPQLPQNFKEAYSSSSNLSEATQKLVNSLFADKGLVILDADCPELKQLLLPVIKEELQNGSSHTLVEKTNQELHALGYEPQVHVRDINLFYLTEDKRLRLTRKGDQIETADGSKRWQTEDLLAEADQHPERFSPNVVLRPLYQEIILPNLAYIGGPAEMIYWLQLKALFDFHKVSFPVLVPRNFVMYLPPVLNQRREKLGLSIEDLFDGIQVQKSKWLEKQGGSGFSLEEETAAIRKIFLQIQEKVKKVDSTLQAVAAADEQKTLKQLGDLEKRVKKSEERVHEQSIKQLEALHQKLFPDGSPQERHDNVLNFLINDSEFINKIYSHLNPLDFSFTVLYED